MPTTQITLTFSTTAGELTADFSTDTVLGNVKQRVMSHFKLDPAKADQLVVTFRGLVLDESKTLGQLDLPQGAVLVIERKEVTKV